MPQALAGLRTLPPVSLPSAIGNSPAATPLHQDFYCKQQEYQVDLDMIWYRDWLFVGHA